MRRIRRRILNILPIPLSSPTNLDNDPDAYPTTIRILELRCSTQGSRRRLCSEQKRHEKLHSHVHERFMRRVFNT